LGILEKDENITEQMVEIVEHLQQYVPRTTDNKIIPILLGGDALSVERGEAARRARSDSFLPEDRLDGLVWKSEDWHGHVISLQVHIITFIWSLNSKILHSKFNYGFFSGEKTLLHNFNFI
jgi:hypothetical protein